MESAKLEEEEFSREKAKEYRKKGENQKNEKSKTKSLMPWDCIR